ncbi:PHP domain-like protein [Vararia minispora EC-137]|uniref:PHP domain-like protein n=1 Tax=Vararia minispora EC-137 TaxID=1314806 RepID=A0ACB8QZ07_9AGAM|nr:PHP domain-like protein [Vararia minispora EC-137]
MIYFDLNVHVPQPASLASTSGQISKKAKGKQSQVAVPSSVAFSSGQITTIEARIDLLVYLGYTVLAFTQTVQKKVEQRTHINILDPLLSQLRKREGIVYLKRITIVLDEESEKGFGLTNTNASLFAPYDIIALAPTTEASFSYAVLTHTLPSNLTAHVLSIPLTLPRLPFRLKHTTVRTALRNGAVFEINYAGALGIDDLSADGPGGAAAKRNWWAAAREVARVTRGKSLIVSSGGHGEAELRAPRDVGNLMTFLDLAHNLTHDAATTIPRSLVLRIQTRKTYRAVFSEPKVVVPEGFTLVTSAPASVSATVTTTAAPLNITSPVEIASGNGKKRPRGDSTNTPPVKEDPKPSSESGGPRKKRKARQQDTS